MRQNNKTLNSRLSLIVDYTCTKECTFLKKFPQSAITYTRLCTNSSKNYSHKSQKKKHGKTFHLLSCLLLLLATTPPTHSNNNETDVEALLSIKKSIHNDPLGALASWNETATHFCKWKGVSCSKRHQNRVISLSLRSLRLVGTLSPHVGNLSFLKILDLKNNTFQGPIPQEIGRLRRLQVIEFSNNSS